MNEQRIIIPLDHGRKHIELIFKRSDTDSNWTCSATDECIQDIVVLMKKEFGVEE